MNFKIVLPSEWEKYKEGILFIEQKLFSDDSAGLVDEPDYIELIVKNPKAIFIIAEDKGIMIGNTYGSPIEDEAHFKPAPQGNLDPRFVKCLREFPSFGKRNTIYVASTALLPEYREKGYALELKKLFIQEAGKKGYKLMTGFVNESSLKLNRKFGAKVIKTLENWFDSGETYYQYYIKL